MDAVGRGFPPGEFRVSDADRARALSELGEALRDGRITADEFDQRAGETLRARTGKELTALLADLPWPSPAATRTADPERADHAFGIRAVMSASAFSAVLLSAKAITDALSPGFSWAGGTVAPAVLAVLLVGLIIVLHVTRADRS
jgi:Domain of unknown function (DUF1707)